MKHLTAFLILLIVCTCAETVRAQAADSWENVSLKGEFTVQLPKSHLVKPQKIRFEQFTTEGQVYTATSEGVDYTVWSLVNESYTESGALHKSAYLDACADLVWNRSLNRSGTRCLKSPRLWPRWLTSAS